MKKTLSLFAVAFLLCSTVTAQWRYSKQVDKMTDETKEKFTLQGKGARLELACSMKASFLYFYSTGRLSIEDFMAGTNVPGSPIRLRLDQKPPQKEMLAITDSQGRGGIITSSLDAILKSKRLLVEYQEDGGSKRIAEFNLAGIEQAAKKLNCVK